MAISKEEILEYISGLSVLELSELVKEFEEKFGVTAQPVALANMEEDLEENQEKNVINIAVSSDSKNNNIDENVSRAIAVISGLQVTMVASDLSSLSDKAPPGEKAA